MSRPLVLDAGALIALERRTPRVVALLKEAVADRLLLVVPAAALAQVWRGSPRQVAVARLLQAPDVIVEPLDEVVARASGALSGRAGTSDVVDASVVVAAREHGAIVVTSDPGDLRRFDAGLTLIAV